jgi:cobalt-zinc-cadmium efflux system outer membrane protein
MPLGRYSCFFAAGLAVFPAVLAVAQSAPVGATAQPAAAQPQTLPTDNPRLEPALTGEPPHLGAPAAQLLQDDRALAQWVTNHSPDVAAARSDVAAATAVGRGSRLIPNPVLDISVSNFSIGHTEPSPRLDKSLIYGAGLSEMVELGKRRPRIAAAGLRTNAAQGRLTATVADRVSDARSALARLIYAQARATELDASLTQARAAAQVAKGRLDHDAMSGVDYDRLLIDLAGIQTEAAHAHADAEAADAQCEATLLAACDVASAGVSALDPAAPIPASWNPADLAKRADVRALQQEGRAAMSDADLAAARAVPDLTFRLGYARDTFLGDLPNQLSLSVSAPLPFADHGQYAKSEALAHAEQYAQQARATMIRARGDIVSLFTRKRSVEGALATLENDSLPRANGVLSAQERGLLEGQLDITDLLLARREAIALRLQVLELRFELFTIRNDLRQALGLDEALAQR